MTITLTTDELEAFQRKLAQWYVLRSQYVLEKVELYDYVGSSRPRAHGDEILRLYERFETESPKPDWRTLL